MPIFGGFCVCSRALGGRWVRWVNMVAFLPSIPVVEDLRALVGRVDTARHHGVPNGCVLEFNLRSVPPETTGFDPLTVLTGGGRPMALRDAVAAIHRAAEDPRVAGLIARVQLPPSPAGAVQELREAIAAFSAVKPSLAWAETYPGSSTWSGRGPTATRPWLAIRAAARPSSARTALRPTSGVPDAAYSVQRTSPPQ